MSAPSTSTRYSWLLANLLFGILPSFLFFVWIERNCWLPVIGEAWPWWTLDVGLAGKLLWNASLFGLFGFAHSALAQRSVHARLERAVPRVALRAFYMIVTGLAVFLLMAFWQATGVLVWELPASDTFVNWLSLTVFWACLLVCGRVAARFGTLYFVGIEQLLDSQAEVKRSAGSPELCTWGLFGFVRHPIYFFTLIAVFVTPVMTLDRLLLGLTMAAYLGVGVPIEERKLIEIFGDDYVEYRRRVPAFVPRIFGRR